MKLSEVIEMRNLLSDKVYQQFESLNLHMESGKLADWLIETGWVTEVPSGE